MGAAKNMAMRMEELGLCDGKEGNVCGSCVCDQTLEAFINDHAHESQCTYCDSSLTKPFAISLAELASRMAKDINQEYGDLEEECWRDDEPDEDGEPVFHGGCEISAIDLLRHVGFYPNNDQLQIDLATHFEGRRWTRRAPQTMSPSHRHKNAWKMFCHEVKHSRRYTFWTSMDDGEDPDHPEHLPSGKMLHELTQVINEAGLIKSFPSGTRYWRAAAHKEGEHMPLPHRFASPPLDMARQPNRMSPSGISMFYGAVDFDTAAKEVIGAGVKEKSHITAVQFESLRDFNILDLASSLNAVSYFAPEGLKWKHYSIFLKEFVKSVSRPIEPDREKHIEYVPTQILTEFVRYEVKAIDGSPVDGIAYPSSLTGKPCVVLFADFPECFMDMPFHKQKLRWVKGSERTDTISQLQLLSDLATNTALP